MANQSFSDLYISDCEKCGAELENWDWCEDDMVFITTCTCGCEYKLEPISGVLKSEIEIEDDEEEYKDYDYDF